MSDAAKSFLSALQNSRLRETGKPAPAQDIQQIINMAKQFMEAYRSDLSPSQKEQAIADYARQWESQRASTPTRFEDPNVYENLRKTTDAVQSVALQLGLPIQRNRILVGTLDSGRVSATTYYLSKSDEYVLTVNLGVWTIVRQFAWVIANAVQDIVPDLPRLTQAVLRGQQDEGPTFETQIRLQLSVNPMIQIIFLRTLMEWALQGGSYPHATTYEEPIKQFGLALQHSIKAFAVAHEHGHIALGHYGGGVTRPTGDTYFGGVVRSSTKENEADETALRILRWMQGIRSPQTSSYAGAGAYFIINDVLSRVLGILKYGDENIEELSDTHPQPLKRWDFLKGTIEAPDYALHEAVMVDIALRVLWQEARPAILQLRENGAKVAAVWETQAPVGARTKY